MRLLKTQVYTTNGFTLIELLVASAVALTVLSIALGVMSEQRRWTLTNSARANANDNLRLVSDLIGQDIKQAGERLDQNTEMPGVSIIPGATAAAPDTLVLQRQVISQTLPVCQNIAAGSSNTSVDVSLITPSTVTNCLYSDGVLPANEPSASLQALKPTDNLRAFRTYRCSLDTVGSASVDPCARTTNTASCQQTGGSDQECGWAYIDDPVNHRGEFFLYSYEDSGNCVTAFTGVSNPQCQKLYRADGKPWQFSYTYTPTTPLASQPKIYILEERQYNAVPDTSNTNPNINPYILQLTINRQTPPLRIANQIQNFSAWAKVPASYNTGTYSWGCAQGGSTGPNPTIPSLWYCTSFNVTAANAPQYINDWQTLQGVRINLTGINSNTNLLNDPNALNNNSLLSLSSESFPRNIVSNSGN